VVSVRSIPGTVGVGVVKPYAHLLVVGRRQCVGHIGLPAVESEQEDARLELPWPRASGTGERVSNVEGGTHSVISAFVPTHLRVLCCDVM
jgi:hypothetical protein